MRLHYLRGVLNSQEKNLVPVFKQGKSDSQYLSFGQQCKVEPQKQQECTVFLYKYEFTEGKEKQGLAFCV